MYHVFISLFEKKKKKKSQQHLDHMSAGHYEHTMASVQRVLPHFIFLFFFE